MSDVMLFGVLRMPYEMAMSSELSRRQFYVRAQELLGHTDARVTKRHYHVRADAAQPVK